MKALFHLLAALLAFVSLAGAAHAAEKAPADVEALLKAMNEQSERLAKQEQVLSDSRKALEDQQRSLLEERARFNDLRSQVIAATGRDIKDPSKPVTPATVAAPSAAVALSSDGKQPAPRPAEVGTDRKAESEKSEKPPEVAAVFDQGGGVTLPKGTLVLTPSIEYARSSATRVEIVGFGAIPAINIGLFEVTKSDRDTYTAALGARYGLTNRFEIEGKIPYIYRSDATRTRPVGVGSSTDTLSTVTGNDIGDVEFGAHYQATNGAGGWPYLIGNLRVKSATGTNPFEVPLNASGVETELPTGSGFWAVQPSVTAIFPSDPVVYYANAGYLYNLTKSFSGIGEVSPGDSVNASFGMSLSLNDKASVSLGYSHNTVFKPKINGQTVAQSTFLQAGTLDLGYSYALTNKTNLNFLVSAGVTEDAPDVRLTFRVPLTFDFK